MSTVLGISCFYHDAAAALVVNGKVVAAAEEERFTRRKHDLRFPVNAIRFCFEHAGFTSADLDLVVYYETPALKADRIVTSCLRNFPRASRLFASAAANYIADRYWVMGHINRLLGHHTAEILFCEHHLSHACSAFLPSPFEEAAVVTLDGVGEWNTATVSHGSGTELRKIMEVNYPHSLGLLYSAFTAFLGFEVNEGEYKLMGLAPYGRPTRTNDVFKLVRLLPNGQFELDLRYFAWEYSVDCLYAPDFLSLFGEPRSRETTLDLDREGRSESQHYANIAASVQKVCEEVILHVVRFAHERTGLDTLCLAGGVALNSVANHRIRNETPFKHIFVQPAAGDSGGALGAALFGSCMRRNEQRPTGPFDPYLGRAVENVEVGRFFDMQAVPYEYFENENALCQTVAGQLADGKVVGWCQGRTEWGPRSLGNRSILANPAHPEMKSIINRKVKFREPFRPFAPAVLEEQLGDYFVLDGYQGSVGGALSPLYYMLEVLPFRDEQRTRFPAVAHVDGTGRVQAVSRRLNSRFWMLIDEFSKLTGVPMLLNTSFNVKGEPMVNSVADAFETFLKTDIDVLVVDNIVVRK